MLTALFSHSVCFNMYIPYIHINTNIRTLLYIYIYMYLKYIYYICIAPVPRRLFLLIKWNESVKRLKCLISALLFMHFFSAMILWSHTHLPSPLSSSITFLIATVTTFDLYQGPAHSISCCYSLLLETSCLCRPRFLFPLTARIRTHLSWLDLHCCE